MTYNEWRDELKNNLLSVSESERRKVLDYYAEAYADRREAGFSEREIIEQFGAPYDAAQRILCDRPDYSDGFFDSGYTRETAGHTNEDDSHSHESGKPVIYENGTCGNENKKSGNEANQTKVKKERKMKPFVKAIIICASIVLTLLIIMLPSLAINGWKFKAEFITEKFVAEEENNKVIVDNSVGSLKIKYYDGEKVQISYPEAVNYKFSISEQNGVIYVESFKPRWYDFTFWHANVPETVINLPKTTVFELDVTVNAGSLRIYEGEYSDISMIVNAGSLNANDVECSTFSAEVNAGSLHVNNLTCTSSFDGEVNAGSLNAKNVSCPSITADVSAGSLNMTINGKEEEYWIDAHVSAGSSNIRSKSGTTDKRLTVDVSAGSLNVIFIS